MTDKVCIGAIAGAFGLSGEVRLKSFCAEPEAIASYGPLTSGDGKLTTSVTLTGSVRNGFSARLKGVTSKEQADALRGVRLYVRRDRLPDLPEDEFYHADLIGLEVLDTGGNRLGRVKAVLNHGASDILEVQVNEDTMLLPFTREVVPTVDTEAGRIVADPPDGVY